VITGYDELLKEPAPLALFAGFGESSLDFRILFWIKRAEDRYRARIQSDIYVEICKALNDAGIQIPFPQRDLHIRTVESGIMKNITGKKGK
jgi:small-conductance mechanosensitive channel